MATTTPPSLPNALAAWKALRDYFPRLRDVHLRTLFAGEPKRGEQLKPPAERNGGIAWLPQLLVGGHQPANFRDSHEASAI